MYARQCGLQAKEEAESHLQERPLGDEVFVGEEAEEGDEVVEGAEEEEGGSNNMYCLLYLSPGTTLFAFVVFSSFRLEGFDQRT